MRESATPGRSRQNRQSQRQQAILEMVIVEGAVRIEQLAERFEVSTMTVHRDLDELENRGLLRKNRGVATAASTSLVESSDVFRLEQQNAEKELIAQAALEFVEPGQSIMLDDSTTVMRMVPHLRSKQPLTVITNTITVVEQLREISGITINGVGGEFYNWCSSFMGRVATATISRMRADICFLSASAISDDIAFHQSLETIDIKQAMFAASAQRVLLVDHTKFDKRALHAIVPLADFDIVIVDAETNERDVARLRDSGIRVIVAGEQTISANPPDAIS